MKIMLDNKDVEAAVYEYLWKTYRFCASEITVVEAVADYSDNPIKFKITVLAETADTPAEEGE